ETTRACDLACRHCRASAVREHDPLALTTAEGRALIDQVCEFGTPHPLLVFTGGDPFKRDDLFHLVEYACEKGLRPGVSPSATPLLNRENLARLQASGARAVSLSLDASGAEAHDAFRGVPGSFDLTMRGCDLVRELGMKLQINTTVSRRNLLDLPRIAARLVGLDVMTWSVFFLVPTGRAQQEDAITAEECEAIMHLMVDMSPYLPLKATEGHHYKRVLIQRQSGEPPPDTPLYRELRGQLESLWEGWQPRAAARRKPMHINSGDGFVFVSHHGDVFPSGFLPLSAGNLRSRSLVDLYRHSELFRMLRRTEALKGRCGSCSFRDVCGGSRSRAYALTGDPLAEEPLCAYLPVTSDPGAGAPEPPGSG
ncbi:MAG: TIGR04053 family radical SAM/SPASM domain-containing protein, partial [Candidatus Eremiobacterota bacterium]